MSKRDYLVSVAVSIMVSAVVFTSIGYYLGFRQGYQRIGEVQHGEFTHYMNKLMEFNKDGEEIIATMPNCR